MEEANKECGFAAVDKTYEEKLAGFAAKLVVFPKTLKTPAAAVAAAVALFLLVFLWKHEKVEFEGRLELVD